MFDVNSVVHFPNVVTLYQNTYDVCFSNVYHNIGHRTGNRHLIQETSDERFLHPGYSPSDMIRLPIKIYMLALHYFSPAKYHYFSAEK